MIYKPPPKKPFEYGDLIAGSFRLVWRHKFLWFFGLFAGTGSSIGGWNCNFTSDFSSEVPGDVSDWVSDHLTLILSLVAAAVLAGILLWLWSILCQGAVIKSVRDIRRGQTIRFGDAFRNGRESFGRLLLFNLFLFILGLGIAVILTAVIVFLIFLAASGETGEIIVGVIGSLFFMAVTVLLIMSFGYLAICTAWIVGPILLTLLIFYSIRAVVLEGLRPVAALKRGLGIMLDNLTRSLLLYLVSVGLSIGAVIAIGFASLLMAIPGAIAWILTINADFPLTGIIISSLLSLPLPVLLVLAASVMNTYFATYWTDIYLIFTREGRDSDTLEPAASPQYPGSISDR